VWPEVTPPPLPHLPTTLRAAIIKGYYISINNHQGVLYKREFPPSWGLDRIDDRTQGDGTYEYTALADDVTVYVIDSGTIYANGLSPYEHPNRHTRHSLCMFPCPVVSQLHCGGLATSR